MRTSHLLHISQHQDLLTRMGTEGCGCLASPRCTWQSEDWNQDIPHLIQPLSHPHRMGLQLGRRTHLLCAGTGATSE